MSNKIILIENQSYFSLDDAQQFFLETALQRVIGAKLFRRSDLYEEVQSEAFAKCVIVLPIVLPSFEEEIINTLRSLQHLKPFSDIFALSIVIFPEPSNFSPTEMLDSAWSECLDKYYDEVIPTSFQTLYKEAAEVQTFNLVSAITSLFRDIDNLAEIERIRSMLVELERKVDSLELSAG